MNGRRPTGRWFHCKCGARLFGNHGAHASHLRSKGEHAEISAAKWRRDQMFAASEARRAAREAEAVQEAPAPEGGNPMNDSDLHRQGGHAGATNPRCPLCNPLDDFREGQIAGATQMADYAAGRLAATRDLLRAAIGTTDADEGLPHFHEADGKLGVFVDRQQVLDTVDRVLQVEAARTAASR